MDKNKKVRDIFQEWEIELPGSDISRTIIFLILALLLLAIISDNPIFKSDIIELETYKRLSTLLLIFSLFFSIVSFQVAEHVLNSSISDLNRYISFYYAKISISIAIFLAFLVICLWVILLGGILNSPFAAILSISPVLLTIQFFRDIKIDYEKIFQVVDNYWSHTNNKKQIKHKDIVKYLTISISILPIVFVILTLIFGQIFVSKYSIHNILLHGKFCCVMESEWFIKVFYFIYYLSVLIAGVGVLPKNVTKSFSQKFF